MLVSIVIALTVLSFLLAYLGFGVTEDQKWFMLRRWLYMFFAIFTMFGTLGTSIALYGSTLPQINTLPLSTNTIYQNLNDSTLTIYVSTQSAQVFVGSNTTVMNRIMNLNSVGGSNVAPNNATGTVLIPSAWYYLVNYTGTTSFIGERNGN